MKQSKKILFVIDNLSYGGAQTHLIDLVNNLSREYQSTIILLSEHAELASRINPAVEIHKEARRWRFDLGLRTRIASRLAEGNFDSIFANSLFSYFFLCSTRKKIGQSFPINVILHSSQILNLKDHLRRLLYTRYKLPQDKFISTCQFQVQYFSKSFRIPPAQFQTIYNGIDTTRFTPAPPTFDRTAFKVSLGIPDAAKVILQVATLRKEKAHQYSIQALEILQQGKKETPYLLIVGGGNDQLQEKLRLTAENAGVSQYVKFCGMQKDLRPYYWISDLFTLSSIAIETFSISALIGMASGIPCVLTDIGGAREMVTDGLNGYVVPPMDPGALADGWRKVMEETLTMTPDQMRTLVEQKFSLDTMVRSYEALIEQ